MASLRKRRRRGRTYYLVRDRYGKEYAAGWSKRAASELLANFDRLEHLARHGALPPEPCTWDLQRLRDWDIARPGVSVASLKRRWRMILAGFGPHTPLEELTAGSIEAYRRSRLASTSTSPATVNRDLSVLRAALARARQPGTGSEYNRDPFAGIKRLKETRARPVSLPNRTVEMILATARRLAVTPEEKQDASIIEVIYRTASRVSQVLELRWSQIQGGQIVFPAHKGGLERVFPYRGALRKALGSPIGSDWVFPSRRRDGPRRGLRRFLRRVLRESGVTQRVTPHTFRHSASSAAFLAGRPIPEIQRLLGHGSPQMAIALYTQLFPEEVKPVPIRATSRRAKNANKGNLSKRKR